MYEPLINIIASETTYEMEGEILRAVQRYAIDVNKEELLKALQYDRDQYNKGYQDGLNADKWIPCSERLPKYTDEYNVTVGVTWELGYFEGITTLRFERIKGKEPRWITPKGEVYRVIAWQPLPEPYKGEQE